MTSAAANLAPSTVNAQSLASTYLDAAGLPNTATNRSSLAAWFLAESAHGSTPGTIVVYNNNPLNITGTGSAGVHKFANNSLSFASYATPAEGAKAWASLLNANSSYHPIIAALSNQNPTALASAVGKSPWGTSTNGILAAMGANVSNSASGPKGVAAKANVLGTPSAPTTTSASAGGTFTPGTPEYLAHNIGVYLGVAKPTPKQQQALTTDINTLAKDLGSPEAAAAMIAKVNGIAYSGPTAPAATPPALTDNPGGVMLPAQVPAYTPAGAINPMILPSPAANVAAAVNPAPATGQGVAGLSPMLIIGGIGIVVLIAVMAKGRGV